MRYLSILAVLFLVACMHETQENVMPETPEEVSTTTQAALDMAYKSNQSVAVLLTQKLIGAKPF